MSATRNFDDKKPGKVIVYDFPRGPYPARVRIALLEKGLHDIPEYKFIDLYKGDHKTLEFKSTKNYSKTIPVFEFADGTLLSECVALTQYIDNIDGNPSLTGTSPLETGKIHMMTRRVEFEFLEAISLYFHNSTAGLGPTVETYQNHEWGLHQLERGINGMFFLDKILQKQPYIVGNQFSMADCAAIGGMIFLTFVNVQVPEDCKALKNWYKRLRERPSVKKYFEMVDNSNN